MIHTKRRKKGAKDCLRDLLARSAKQLLWQPEKWGYWHVVLAKIASRDVKEDICMLFPVRIMAIFLVCCFILVFCSCKENTTDTKAASNGSRISKAPPRVDLNNPADYCVWLNEHFAVGKDKDARFIYEPFWGKRGEQAMLAKPSDDVGGLLFELANGPTWTPDAYPLVDDYIQSVHEQLIIFKRAVSKVDYAACFFEDSTGLLLPDYSPGKLAVATLLAQGWQAGPDQCDRLLKAWTVGLGHARHLEGTSERFSIGAGWKVRRIVYQSMAMAIQRQVLTASDFERLNDILCDLVLAPKDISNLVLAEWAKACGAITLFYPNGRLNEEMVDMLAGVDVRDVKRVSISAEKLIGYTEAYFTDYMAIARTPLDAKLLKKAVALETQFAQGPLANYPLRRWIVPPLGHVLHAELYSVAASRAHSLIVKLAARQLQTGSWPSALSEIAATSDCSILKDPFDGGEFCYKDDKDGYVLYSVGPDGVDDGGQPGTISLYKPLAPHTDIVFWPPHL